MYIPDKIQEAGQELEWRGAKCIDNTRAPQIPEEQRTQNLNPEGYKRVLLKISGEALASIDPEGDKNLGIDQKMLEKIAQDIKVVYDQGIEVCLVVGGGNIYRGVHGMARHGMDRTTSDHMGMLATVINGMALQHAVESQGLSCRLMSAIPIPTVGESYIRRRAIRHMERGRVVLFVGGTGIPYFTTDTTAALRASEMNCDLILKATKVQGVYTKDPAYHNDAEFLPHLTYDEVLAKNLKVMDTAAIVLASENHIPIAVFSIYEENGFAKVVNGQGHFSLIS